MINKTKTIIALHLLAIVVAAGVSTIVEEKVFAQSTTSNTASNSIVDQPNRIDSQHGQQTGDNVDSQNDGETNDYNDGTSEV